MTGRILKGIGGFYYVNVQGKTIQCKARGIFKKDGITPMTGDLVRINSEEENTWIEEIYPRKNSLVRPAVANIDLLVVVVAVTPSPQLALVDKMLVTASAKNIPACLCVNKIDLGKCPEIEKIYQDAGYKVFVTSAIDNTGINKLSEYLKDKFTAFAGNSGVGKSSVLNSITGKTLETGGLSQKISRGKHTTRHVELIELECGGYVFDTPGFSSYELSDIKAADLSKHFPEFESSIGKCKFSDCAHIKETGCDVIARVQSGEISASRHEHYCDLYNQLKLIKDWE